MMMERGRHHGWRDHPQVEGGHEAFRDDRVATGRDPNGFRRSDHAQGAAAKELASGATDKMNIAQVVHRAAGEFEREIPQAGQYIHSAANQIDTVAKAVRDRDIGQLYNEVRDFARRQPTAFFGGAVILGFAAIRFFKSAQTAGETIAASEPAQAAPGNDPRHSAHLM